MKEEEVLGVALNVLQEEEINKSLIYWDKKLLKKNENVLVGLEKFTMPFEGYMIFVDLMPRANWAHPCIYIFFNSKTLETRILRASFPPYSAEYPETFRILLRYGNKPPHNRYFRIFD